MPTPSVASPGPRPASLPRPRTRRQPSPATRPAGAPEVAYQPFVALRTGELAGVEALARFGPVSTLRLVRMAEAIGRIDAIDHAMLRRVLRDVEATPGFEHPVHVNLSPRSLAWPEQLRQLTVVLSEHPIAARRVILELTETAPLPRRTVLRRFADAVRELGARIAIDDVPAGHDRFLALAVVRPDVVKLDGGTLRRALRDSAEAMRLRTSVSLARNVGAEVIAEGIETPACVEASLQLGVGVGQGFALGLPLCRPLSEVAPYQVEDAAPGRAAAAPAVRRLRPVTT